MKIRDLIVPLLLAMVLAGQAHAQLAPPASAPVTAPVTAPAAPKKAEPNEANLQTHGHYVNKAGQAVHSPAKAVDGKVPAGASAQCRDGSYSFSKSHRGTCSHHGGVASWL
jgi:hypothetical protein